jgi:hypothetical protein
VSPGSLPDWDKASRAFILWAVKFKGVPKVGVENKGTVKEYFNTILETIKMILLPLQSSQQAKQQKG